MVSLLKDKSSGVGGRPGTQEALCEPLPLLLSTTKWQSLG